MNGYNAVQAQVNLANYPLETAKILHQDIFWFFMKDEDFVTKRINEGNVDIQKFPASKGWQLAKRWRVPRLQLNIFNKLLGTHQQHKYNGCDIQCTHLPARNYPRRKQSVTRKQKLQHPRTLETPTSWKIL